MEEEKEKKARVLVADDDHSIRQLVCTIIKREGLEVDCAADGFEAIEMLREHEYAVILLDLMMPRVDGFGVVEHLKNHPPSHKPVILVISAYADQKFKEVDPSMVAGVIRKPFEVSDLGTLVRLCVHGFDHARDLLREQALSDAEVRELTKDWQHSTGGTRERTETH